MKNSKYMAIIALFAITFLAMSCSDNSSNPTEDKPIPCPKNNYTLNRIAKFDKNNDVLLNMSYRCGLYASELEHKNYRKWLDYNEWGIDYQYYTLTIYLIDYQVKDGKCSVKYKYELSDESVSWIENTSYLSYSFSTSNIANDESIITESTIQTVWSSIVGLDNAIKADRPVNYDYSHEEYSFKSSTEAYFSLISSIIEERQLKIWFNEIESGK